MQIISYLIGYELIFIFKDRLSENFYTKESVQLQILNFLVH